MKWRCTFTETNKSREYHSLCSHTHASICCSPSLLVRNFTAHRHSTRAFISDCEIHTMRGNQILKRVMQSHRSSGMKSERVNELHDSTHPVRNYRVRNFATKHDSVSMKSFLIDKLDRTAYGRHVVSFVSSSQIYSVNFYGTFLLRACSAEVKTILHEDDSDEVRLEFEKISWNSCDESRFLMKVKKFVRFWEVLFSMFESRPEIKWNETDVSLISWAILIVQFSRMNSMINGDEPT